MTTEIKLVFSLLSTFDSTFFKIFGYLQKLAMKRSKPACGGRKTPVYVSDERVQGRFTL